MPRPTFLPYTKTIDIGDTYASGIHFTDLAGNTVNASYVQVATLEESVAAAGGVADRAWFAVEPSSLVVQTYATATAANLPGATNASAMVMGGPNNPVVELSLPYNQTINSVKITNNLATSSLFAVTYGHIKNAPDITDIRILDNGTY